MKITRGDLELSSSSNISNGKYFFSLVFAYP